MVCIVHMLCGMRELANEICSIVVFVFVYPHFQLRQFSLHFASSLVAAVVAVVVAGVTDFVLCYFHFNVETRHGLPAYI